MVFKFENKKLYLISNNVRMIQDINTDTKKPFKDIDEAKEWAKKYFCRELEFIEEKIDVQNLILLNQLNILNIENEEDVDNENLPHFRIHNYNNDEIVFSQEFKALEDLKNFDINNINLDKGKYYFSVSNLEDIFFEKDNISFTIE